MIQLEQTYKTVTVDTSEQKQVIEAAEAEGWSLIGVSPVYSDGHKKVQIRFKNLNAPCPVPGHSFID